MPYPTVPLHLPPMPFMAAFASSFEVKPLLGPMIFMPEWSEYLDARRVRHLWECEACGYKFETLVCFPE